MKKVSYLGYRFRKGGGKKHMERRVKKAMEMMGQVWGIEKRRFGGGLEEENEDF